MKVPVEGGQDASEGVRAIEEQDALKRGLMNEINDVEKMLELGRMALERYEEYERVFALPSFMEYESV